MIGTFNFENAYTLSMTVFFFKRFWTSQEDLYISNGSTKNTPLWVTLCRAEFKYSSV